MSYRQDILNPLGGVRACCDRGPNQFLWMVWERPPVNTTRPTFSSLIMVLRLPRSSKTCSMTMMMLARWQQWRPVLLVVTMLLAVTAAPRLSAVPADQATTTIESGVHYRSHRFLWHGRRIGKSSSGNDDNDHRRRRRRRQLQKRIVGGKPVTTTTDQDKRLAAVFAFSAGSKLCGATIIHPDVLLTAAHCIGAFLDDGALLGGVELSGMDATEFFGVVSELSHPRYQPGSEQNDIMLVKLDRSIGDDTPLVRYNVDASVPGMSDTLQVVGFGRTSTNGTNAAKLQQVQVSVVSNDECQTKLRAQGLVVDPVTMLCSGTTR
jgi:V8-like Glu-specific endopeptidase